MPLRAVDWLFRSRKTGRITIAQFPNLALAVFLGAAVVNSVVQPSRSVGQAVRLVGMGALLVWGVDEVLRGVNPWRRFLGGGILAWEALRFLSGGR